MFGIRSEVRDRRAAKAGARGTTLGIKVAAERWQGQGEVALRILTEAEGEGEGEGEETRERDVVEESPRKDSAVDTDRL
ncbi:hypothetical protein [Bosea psychrotolerans]|uniref:Uncharacterized protein n=1 Tax=Bosea psychrotolerans TaxID=1871628 RepID=A0A2S4M836_9HYPH|nr:hypothetical protein [Bosea psychrotolerans]POR50892.1 hypothetical protein CYD53_108140 [Bosea psychrotolerans]